MNLEATVDHSVEAAYQHSTGSQLSRFFTALRDECAIYGARCRRCGKVSVPPGGYCELCGGELGDWLQVGPGGIVRGLTQTGGARARTIVRVRLDGADTDFIHLGRDDVTHALRVVPVWSDERSGTIRDIECFAPDHGHEPAPARALASETEPVTALRSQLYLHYRQAIGEVELRFRQGLTRREIWANRCPDCNAVYVPPRPFCPRCFVRCDAWRQLADTGAVTAFVVVNVPFTGQEIEIPYVLAHILLDGADATFFHLVGVVGPRGKLAAPSGGVRAGLRVRAAWRPDGERRGLLNDDIDHFEPVT